MQTLKGIDEIKSGICKADVFFNLLNCLDVEIDAEDKALICAKFQIPHQGVNYVKYSDILKALRFDNHSERWVTVLTADDHSLFNRGKSTGNLAGRNKLRYSLDASRGQLRTGNLKRAFGGAKDTNDLNEASDGEDQARTVASRRTASQAGTRKSATFSETLAKQRELFKRKEMPGKVSLSKSMVSSPPTQRN